MTKSCEIHVAGAKHFGRIKISNSDFFTDPDREKHIFIIPLNCLNYQRKHGKKIMENSIKHHTHFIFRGEIDKL